jgi:trans-aconitate methyltransferase
MTSTTDPDYTPAYTLDNAWRAARDRLSYLEQACDPVTAARLDKVGVGPGWHCLEVGAGGGSVVRMLCDRVGPEGSVLAVDLEPALLADLERPNLEVRRMDVVVDELPEAAFDLIHTRAVLMHIPQRNEVLVRLVRALRPGGYLLLEEMDLTPTFEANDLLTRTMTAMYRPILDAGAPIALYWAATMAELFEPAGLVDVESDRALQTFTGGSALANFWRITWEQFLESQPYTEAERAVIEDGMAAMGSSGDTYACWDMVAAWGRRP